MNTTEIFVGYIFFIVLTFVIWVRMMVRKLGPDTSEWEGFTEMGLVMSALWPILWLFVSLYWLITRAEKILKKKDA
jgi:preprotein translocase subunit YajC